MKDVEIQCLNSNLILKISPSIICISARNSFMPCDSDLYQCWRIVLYARVDSRFILHFFLWPVPVQRCVSVYGKLCYLIESAWKPRTGKRWNERPKPHRDHRIWRDPRTNTNDGRQKRLKEGKLVEKSARELEDFPTIVKSCIQVK